jgi:GTP cyclohydrolase I
VTPRDPDEQTEALDETQRPSRDEAEAAVRTLILWAGDDPAREGLLDTPGRVVRAYEEYFQGYAADPVELMQRTFEEPAGVAGAIEGAHQCMTTRGVHTPGSVMVTSRMLGGFRTDPSTRRQFLSMIANPSAVQVNPV